MVSRTQQLLQRWFSEEDVNEVREKALRITRGDDLSGIRVLQREPERIASYIKDYYLNRIFDKKSARQAVNSLKTDSTMSPLGDVDFKNLLVGAGMTGKNSFTEYLFDAYGRTVHDRIEESRVTLRTGKVRSGFEFSNRTYVIVITSRTGNKYIQARSFKTGRAVKINKAILRERVIEETS